MIEKKALATTVALSLLTQEEESTISSPLERTILLNGVSEGEIRLPYTVSEVEAIAALYPHEKLFNDTFTKSNFLGKLEAKPYSVIHIASHGQFKSSFKDSFIHTIDSKKPLDMNDLKKIARWGTYRDQMVELLTLSACESATGNEQATLGLSGIAVRAGAKTAVGSLWRVSDLSTCYLMESFYRHLKDSQFSGKAKALQQAQLQLLKGEVGQGTSACQKSSPEEVKKYRQPYYWSGFLVIGDWQ